MSQKLTKKGITAIGLTFFAMFLGAGNIIFPPVLGHAAGEHLPITMIGFLLTAVGLPFLAILAISRAGSLESLARGLGTTFALVITVIIYIMLGPFFGLPRTGSVSYEIAVVPFLSEQAAGSWVPPMIFSVIFFGLTLLASINPKSVVDSIGKILAPALLIVIAVLTVQSVINPMGSLGEADPGYAAQPFSSGFVQGYFTMDVISALIIGVLITTMFGAQGVTNRATIVRGMVTVGIMVAVGLTLVYIGLAYIGATAPVVEGTEGNGAAILATASRELFGSAGGIILGAVVILACFTTAIGLVVALASYFASIMPKVSYKTFVVIFSIAGALVANVGLTTLISIAFPVLMVLYPVAIVLVLMFFFGRNISQDPIIMWFTVGATLCISILDGIKAVGTDLSAVDDVLSYIPLYSMGLGWVVPALVGLVVGFIIRRMVGAFTAPAEEPDQLVERESALVG